jgi:hypothetical protein
MTEELDNAARRLVAIAARLRNDIDIHRFIGLNTKILKKANLPHQFVGQSQSNALLMIIVGIRKAFDRPRKNQDMHSIPAVITLLSDPHYDPSDARRIQVARQFATEFGLLDSGSTAAEILHSAHEDFVRRHGGVLERLRYVRNKEVAHIDADYQKTPAGSHNFYEEVFRYIRGFHRVLCDGFGTPTTLIPHSLGMELFRFLKSIDPGAKRDFR